MSYLQCTPATIQVPCTGGTTTHILEAIGTERLAFKVKLRQKYYDLYRVSPPLGFVKPGVKKELQLQRMPGKPGKTKLIVEYIASPKGYDPRKPFIQGADIGLLKLRVRAYIDKKVPDQTPLIAGKVVTKEGQKFSPAPSVNDAKLEEEIEALYKDKEKAAQVLKAMAREKGAKEESSSSGDDEKKGGARSGKSPHVGTNYDNFIVGGASADSNKLKKGKASAGARARGGRVGETEAFGARTIQVVMPNILKEMNMNLMQKNNDELKALLQLVVNENKRLEDVVSQMMKEITFLRESLLSTVLKMSSGSGGVAADTSSAGAGAGAGAGSTRTALTGSTGAGKFAADGAGGASGAKGAGEVAVGGGGTSAGGAGGGGIAGSGAGPAVEAYLSAMMAGGGPTGGTKVGSGGGGGGGGFDGGVGGAGGYSGGGGGLQEFSLYAVGGGRGTTSGYATGVPTVDQARRKDLNFAFGNTADQLGPDGGCYGGGGSSGAAGAGGGGYGGGGSSSAAGAGGGGGKSTTSVYL